MEDILKLSNMAKLKLILIISTIGFSLFLISGYYLQKNLLAIYNSQKSIVMRDRNGEEIFIKPNQKGYFTRYLDEIPPRFKELLIKKEDKYFYYHFGFNPGSIFKALLGRLGILERKASSTITQQLVKILLGKEFERNFKNKFGELFYTLSLETYLSKDEILKMYLNSIYLGNQAQGIAEASWLYFNLPPDLLNDGQILQLLATISNPYENNPAKYKNKGITLSLAKKFGLGNQELIIDEPKIIKENMKKYSHYSNSYFEIQNLTKDFPEDGQLTIDKELSERIREILKRNIENLKPKNVKNGAVVVIKLPENEILALIGSPNPQSFELGYQINMLNKPRAIGSTIKPFIYLKAFKKGLRPYTLVDDREYKYLTALGFPLYPKNFDYQYRGEINLHYALSNSLNVPTVKVLEYLGLEDFYKFLEKDLEFKPIQSLENYQLGIALGGLEMSLLDLAKYFTIFPNNGILRETKIFKNEGLSSEKKISNPEYIQLVNKILNDRKTGIEQFGLKSELNLFQENYGLKTGTSRNFHDSWIIGFTPDFLVGVWIGNADNTPMDGISGQIGAGRIWAEIMELILNSKYNKETPFKFDLIREFYNSNGGIEFGLENDDYQKSLNALKERDFSLILNPHQGDFFLLEENSQIILEAKENVKWFINGKLIGEGKSNIFIPQESGSYQIKAELSNGFQETVTILVND